MKNCSHDSSCIERMENGPTKPIEMLELNVLINGILVGIILCTQFVSYPLFKSIEATEFRKYHSTYTRYIAPVVGPLMVLELIIVGLLTLDEPTNPLILASLFLVIMVWLSTFLIQVPLHNKLAKRYQVKWIHKLIYSNWIRSIAWTIKLIVAAILI